MSDIVPDARAILAARERIAGTVHRTPLLSSHRLSARVGRPVHLKSEHVQKTGSFKARGALNFVKTLSEEEAARGVVTISAGNHAQALAWAASHVGIPATVVMPGGASKSKAEASAEYGAEVIVHGSVFEAFQLSYDLAEERGLTFAHPFDHESVLAGQATVVLEILEDLPDVETIVVPIGGGGLCGGIAAGLAAVGSTAELIGVEPVGAAGMRKSMDAGQAVQLEHVDTIADGLAAPMAGSMTFPLIRDRARDVVLVSDDEIASALACILSYTKQMVEPGGAAGVAALLSQRVPPGTGPVAVVLSGGNVDLDRLPGILARAGDEA